MNYRVIRIPRAEYDRAMNKKIEIYQSEGVKLPLWKCFAVQQSPKKQKNFFDKMRL